MKMITTLICVLLTVGTLYACWFGLYIQIGTNINQKGDATLTLSGTMNGLRTVFVKGKESDTQLTGKQEYYDALVKNTPMTADGEKLEQYKNDLLEKEHPFEGRRNNNG